MEKQDELTSEFITKYFKHFKEDIRLGWEKFFLEKFKTTHFITLNFNKYLNDDKYWNGLNKRSWTTKRKIEHVTEQVEKWSSKLQQLVLGKTWNRNLKEEKILGVLFLENVKTNLHLHGFISVRKGNWKFGLEDKIKRFEDNVGIWGKRFGIGGSVELGRVWTEDFNIRLEDGTGNIELEDDVMSDN
jgi:hypothetical protein